MFRSLFKRKTLVDYINENDIENIKKCKDQMTESIYIDAIMNKKYETVKVLFNNALLEKETQKNNTQIPLLIEYQHNELVKSLPIIDEYLLIACKYKNSTLVEYFLSNGVNVNIVDKFQFNCLTYCVNNDDIDTAKILIRYKINRNYKNPRNLKNSVTEFIGSIPAKEDLYPPGLVCKADKEREKRLKERRKVTTEAVESILRMVYEAGRAADTESDSDDVLPNDD
jgi:ankyrin repeat protein